MLNGKVLLGAAVVAVVGIAAAMLALESTRTPAPSAEAVPIAASAPLPAASSAPVAEASVAPAPADGFVVKRILPIDGPIKYGEWHWDETGVPAGPIVVTVDLAARVISVFRGGYEIGAAAVLLGTDEKPTPTGVFPIMEKKRDHVSNLYDAPMPWMQRLTNDGITLHATKVEWGYASHGCIGMPEAFARKVFETTHLGDRVYITRGKTVGMGDSLVS